MSQRANAHSACGYTRYMWMLSPLGGSLHFTDMYTGARARFGGRQSVGRKQARCCDRSCNKNDGAVSLLTHHCPAATLVLTSPLPPFLVLSPLPTSTCLPCQLFSSASPSPCCNYRPLHQPVSVCPVSSRRHPVKCGVQGSSRVHPACQHV